MKKNEVDNSKRKFIKKASYIAPAVITLKAMPSFASNGSASPVHIGGGGGGLPQNSKAKP